MQYMMMFYETAGDLDARTNPAKKDEYWGAWMAYVGALREAGVNVGGGALQPPLTGTTVRAGAGGPQVQDGPYADTKEQLGGYIVIEVPDLDAAIKWASRCPAASTGAVEIRPLLPMT